MNYQLITAAYDPIPNQLNGWLVCPQCGRRQRLPHQPEVLREYQAEGLVQIEEQVIDVAYVVDRLRLAATTQSTNIALLGRTAAEIGKVNRGKQAGGTQAADVLPGIGASVPLIDVSSENQQDRGHNEL